MNNFTQYKSVGYACYRGSINSILVEGPDAWDFLNRITTRQFTESNVGESVAGALLTGRSDIQSLFQAWNWGSKGVELFPLVGGYESLLQNLDKLHFSEKLELKLQGSLMWVELRGDNIPFAKTNKVTEENIGGKQILIVPLDNWGIPGVLLGASEIEDLTAVIKIMSLKVVDDRELKRIEEYFGFATEKDFVSKYQILEMNLDRFLDRNKGCYPGQEVVEKIFTYGKPAKKLVRIKLKANEEEIKLISSHSDKSLYTDNVNVGSWLEIHSLQKGELFSLGVVQRSVVEKGQSVAFGANGPVGHIELLT